MPRCGAKAVILEVDPASGRPRILCLRKQGDIGLFYVLPGGGQDEGELLPDTLIRECREELGAAIEVGALRFVQEYVGDNHEFKSAHGGRHYVNLYFSARLLEPIGTHALQPDPGQVGLDWLDIGSLAALPFYPRVVGKALALAGGSSADAEAAPAYLGDSV